MNPEHRDILTELEKDAFKEIINIAFGKAAASLADIIGLYEPSRAFRRLKFYSRVKFSSLSKEKSMRQKA